MAAPARVSSTVESINPATGEKNAEYTSTPPGELPRMFAEARRAQVKWAATPLGLRSKLARNLGHVVYARRQEMAALVTREMGKPAVEALLADVLVSLDVAYYYAARAPRLLRPERVPHHNLAMKAKSGWLCYEPYGVIGIISPWNYPLAIPLGEIIPALLAGNAVVFKPSELTPACGALIGDLVAQAGFPPGLVQVLQGGGEVGEAMLENRPDKLVFTGSFATGRRVAEACARQLIPCVLELGGKDAMIVLEDADIEIASSAAVWGGFTNCGQACLSVERVYVHQSIARAFSERCAAKARLLKLGPGSDPETEVGPMVRAVQIKRVQELLDDALARGAQVLAGGRQRAELGPCFYEPTVVADVDHSMRLMQEETFGPILALQTVSDDEEAVSLANDSPFALSASIWTKNAKRGRELASRICAGAVMVNDVASYFAICEAPHGGRGQSGWGRTHSRLGLLELVQVKYVDVDRLPGWPKSWWYGYNRQLSVAADQLLEFLFAPGWRHRLRHARGALRSVFRGHRI